MTSAGSLDANVLLRLVLNDVPEQHRAAVALLAGGGPFAVSDTALIEVTFVLGRAYGLSRDQQREAVVGLLQQRAISGDTNLFGTAFDVYTKHPKLSFEDCYLVACAERDGAVPLWTFDRKLASQTSAGLVGASVGP